MAGAAPKMPEPKKPVVRDTPAVSGSGENIFVPSDTTEGLEASGGRVMTPESAAQAQHDIAVKNEPFSMVDYMAAGAHGRLRGQAEAFGVPIDEKIVDFASALGDPDTGEAVKKYIKKLEEVYPNTSAINRTLGTIGGAVAGAELTGGGVSGIAKEGWKGVAGRAARGGVENVAQNYASDFNEAALGGPPVNGEKMFAAMPKHFLLGGGAVLGVEGLGAVGSRLLSKGAEEAAPALERGAYSAVARDAGGDAALGERIVGLNQGRIPGSASEVADILSAEQGAIRKGAEARRGGVISALEEQHAQDEAFLGARQDAARRGVVRAGEEGVSAAEARRGELILDAMGRGGKGVENAELQAMQIRKGLENEAREIDSFRGQVRGEYETAKELESRLGKERAAHSEELEKALEKVNDINADRAIPDYDPAYIRSIVGRDAPSALDYFGPMDGSHLTKVAKAMESAESVAAEEQVRRLAMLGQQIDLAHKEALGHVTNLEGVMRTLDYQYAERLAYISGAKVHPGLAAAEASIGRAGKEGQKLVGEATKEADAAVGAAKSAEQKGLRDFEKVAEKEKRALSSENEAELKKVPKASQKTELDANVAAARAASQRTPEMGGSLLGAGISIGHGNVLGAGMALLSGYASSTARVQGNYLAARVMRGLARELTAVDQAVKAGAAKAVGVGARAGAVAALPKGEKKERKELSFEKVSERVLDAASNPMIVQNRVQMAMGGWAAAAPMLYASTLTAAERAQAFLLSVLPRPQIDRYSLTPQLEKADVPDSQKYDFMQYVAAIDDPFMVLRDVHEGTVTDQQITAVREVYPALYAQMQTEVRRQMLYLSKPMDYDREINVGRLLEVRTNEVLDPQFQNMLRIAYEEKFKKDNGPAGGSRSSSDESRVSKMMMSDAQRVERGE